MGSTAAALRAVELATYPAAELVRLLRATHRREDFEAVALVLSARERRADQAEAQHKATLADALRKVQAHEDRHRASLAEAEASARLKRTAEEEARAVLTAAVSEIHEAGKKKRDEVSARLDAVMAEIYELRKKQQEEFSDSVARIAEETEAKIRASFAKIHAPLKKPERDAVPTNKETPHDTGLTLALATPSIEVAELSKQRVVEMVKVNKEGGAAGDGSAGDKSLKRKVDAVENRGVTPVQISGGSDETMVALKRKADAVEIRSVTPVQIWGGSDETMVDDIGVPPGFSPTPQFSDSVPRIMVKTGAKLRASFAKIHAPLKKAERNAVPSQDTALALASPSMIEVAQQSKQRVEEMVNAHKGGGAAAAAADGSGDKSLKTKADAVENRGVTPIQISGGSGERMVDDIGVFPGFNPTPQFSSSSWIFEKAGPSSYTPPSQAVEVSAKVSKEVASVQGSGKTVTLKEPAPLEETGEGREHNAPNEATQEQHGAKDLEGASMSLFTVPVQLVRRFDRGTVSKRGRGRGRSTAPKEKAENNNVSMGGGSPGRGRGGRSSNTSGNLLLGRYSLNRPSPVAAALARTVRTNSSGTENASQSRNDDPSLPSNASARGKAEMNIASSSGHATAATRPGYQPMMPRSSALRIGTVSPADIVRICMGGRMTENFGKCAENKTDSVPVMDSAAEGTSHEQGDVGTSSNGTGGAFRVKHDKP